MTKEEAYKIFKKFYRNDNPNENDEFVFVEACNFLIETENDANVMSSLGGFYYGKEKYDLAEKYYLMADENGDKYAACGLGFIYYYGRNGAKNFDKAFYYYNKAMNYGDKEAAMKIADMYHNGYGCTKDDKKYRDILEKLFEDIKDTKKLFEPYPEIAHRLADIYINEGHGKDCEEMLVKAKDFITQRIRYNPFWGNFIVCRRVISLYYKVFTFNFFDFDVFDLFYLFLKEHTVSFLYNGNKYLIESFFDEGQMRVRCNGTFYKSTEDFLTKSLFENKHIYIIHYDGDYYSLKLVK